MRKSWRFWRIPAPVRRSVRGLLLLWKDEMQIGSLKVAAFSFSGFSLAASSSGMMIGAFFYTDKRNRHNTISGVGHVRTPADLISLIYFYHAVAHTYMCLDVLGGLLCWLQLFPQCCHKYPQRSHIVIPTVAPDILCDKSMGQYLADILG